jgi:hypothetical protein
MNRPLKWWEYPLAAGTALIILGFHMWKAIDDRLKKEGV